MSTFNDREQNFEAKYALDENLRFKTAMRRNKLMGLWAAAEFGMSAEDALVYAKTVIDADFEEVGDKDVIRKVLADFRAHKIEMTEHHLEHRLQECLEKARDEIMQENNF